MCELYLSFVFSHSATFFIGHISSPWVPLLSLNGNNVLMFSGVWWFWKGSQIGNWIHYCVCPSLLLHIHHNGLVNLFQTIACYDNYFGHVQNNNYAFCDSYFCHRIPNWQEYRWVNSNSTVVLQADVSDKQKTVLDRLTEWIQASAKIWVIYVNWYFSNRFYT